MKLTIALQNGMKAKIDRNGNVVIDIPDTSERDIWGAYMKYLLEKDFPTYKNAKVDEGFFKIIENKVRFIRNNY